MLELKKQQVKIQDERIQNNALVRRLAREETLKEIAREAVAAMESKVPLQRGETRSVSGTSEEPKEAILQISDWHYGLEVDNFLNRYSPAIARARVQQLCDQAIARCHHDGIHKIHVVNLGDLISGRIHLPLRVHSRIDVVTQTMEVSELLA